MKENIQTRVIINKVQPVFEDNRGKIFDLLDDEVIMHVGIITSEPGAIRGNHYHKITKQFNYIIKGKAKLNIKYVDNGTEESFEVGVGDFISIPPRVVHTFTAIDYFVMLDLNTLSRSDDGYEKDTIRV